MTEAKGDRGAAIEDETGGVAESSGQSRRWGDGNMSRRGVNMDGFHLRRHQAYAKCLGNGTAFARQWPSFFPATRADPRHRRYRRTRQGHAAGQNGRARTPDSAKLGTGWISRGFPRRGADMYEELAILAVFGFAYACVSGRVERSGLSGPIVFVLAGLLLGPDPRLLDAPALRRGPARPRRAHPRRGAVLRRRQRRPRPHPPRALPAAAPAPHRPAAHRSSSAFSLAWRALPRPRASSRSR